MSQLRDRQLSHGEAEQALSAITGVLTNPAKHPVPVTVVGLELHLKIDGTSVKFRISLRLQDRLSRPWRTGPHRSPVRMHLSGP